MKCVLISMPWASASRPNLSVGVLVAAARRRGFECISLDASLHLAAHLGHELYQSFSQNSRFFGLCEHLFAVQAFGRDRLDSDRFLRTLTAARPQPESEFFFDLFTALRDRAIPAFLQEMTDRIVDLAPDILGFSCTFNQVFASLALASRIRSRAPETCTLMGGGCVHGEMGMEYARQFPAILNHVFVGEADETFPEFLRRFAEGSPIRGLAGVTVDGRLSADAAPVERMNDVPAPDYDDFFDLRSQLIADGHALPELEGLPFESSRGCWWGAKNHCTFCGLNARGMAHRAKSASQTLEEIRDLAGRYRGLDLLAADNILNMEYFETLLPMLKHAGWDLRIFYEVKANLRRLHFPLLRDAGVRWIQPGIESFSTNILRCMNKGVSALQNVRFLRLAREYGIQTSYNLLTGFHGETEADYVEMIGLINRLHHLPPPSGAPGAAQIHRFSPFHAAPSRHGFKAVRPLAYYSHLVPDHVPLDKIAYFFDADREWETPPSAGQSLQEAVARWMDAKPTWTLRVGPDGILSEQTAEGRRSAWMLTPLESLAVVLADNPVPLGALQAKIAAAIPRNAPQGLEHCLRGLIARGLLVADGCQVVADVPFQTAKTDQDLLAMESQFRCRVGGPSGFAGEGGAATAVTIPRSPSAA